MSNKMAQAKEMYEKIVAEKRELYVKICERAEKEGLYKGERISLLMDLECADFKFNLRLEELLNAETFDFAHDVMGIVAHIDRSEYPATNFNLFVPRYSNLNDSE